MPPTKAKNPPAEPEAIDQITPEAAAADQVTKSGETPADAALAERAVTEAAPVEPAAPAATMFTHRITAVPEKGFCRAGRRWYREATAVNRDDFSDEQWAAIEDEPMLVVVAL